MKCSKENCKIESAHIHGDTFDFPPELYRKMYFEERQKSVLKIIKERASKWLRSAWNTLLEKLYL